MRRQGRRSRLHGYGSVPISTQHAIIDHINELHRLASSDIGKKEMKDIFFQSEGIREQIINEQWRNDLMKKSKLDFDKKNWDYIKEQIINEQWRNDLMKKSKLDFDKKNWD